MKINLDFKNYDADSVDIYIYGDVIDDTQSAWISRDINENAFVFPEKIINQMKEIENKHINLHVSSDGGDCMAGIAIMNLLKAHAGGITVFIDSHAASIASVIAVGCGADRIVMPSNTFLYVHMPSGGGFGESGYLRGIADYLDNIADLIADVYAENAVDGKDKAYFMDLMAKGTWISADEAKETFKNVEIADSMEFKAVASMSKITNAPDCINFAKHEAIKAEERAKRKMEILKILEESLK